LAKAWKETENILLSLPSLQEIKLDQDIQQILSSKLRSHLEKVTFFE